MLKDITTIQILGAIFSNPISFSLFDPKDGKDKDKNDIFKTIKGTLIYGRNGTGKSTIAKAFRKLKGEDLPAIIQTTLFDKDNHIVNLSDDEKKHLFIFDEDYVNAQVKLKQDHLDTIVMLGAAADLANKIEIAERARDTAKEVFDNQGNVFKEYEDSKNSKSPTYWLNCIANKLRGNDSWADRDRKISGRKTNTQVKDDTYKQFINLKPTLTRSELIIEFGEQMKALKDAQSGLSKIDIAVPKLPESYSQYNDNTIKQLLTEIIQKPNLSEREQYLVKLVEEGKVSVSELTSKMEFFKQDNINTCPYCFQPVSTEHRINLVASIEKILSRAVSDHQEALKSHVYKDINLDLSRYELLGAAYQNCVALIEKINSKIQQNNDLINRKIENPYEPITSAESSITQTIEQLISALEILETQRIEHNKKATDPSPIIAKLNKINSNIAYYDIANLVVEYNKQLEEQNTVNEKYTKAKLDYEAKKVAVEDLDAQRKNVHHAIDIINDCMKYIFFAENRLKIDYVDGEYRLYSKGKSVHPCDVSVGERNIIGLSYFFTSIMEGQEEKDVYGKEYLLIIDDPISSYDIENRIGILSFLKYKLSLFLEGNESTKSLVMTHDLMSFYDIHKVFEEIIDNCKKKGYSLQPKFNKFEMSNNAINSFQYNKRQEYTEILKKIFIYGEGTSNEYDIIIGNLMRQALEAFSTFEYKKGIEDVSTDSDILALLPAPEYKAYYKNLMYRLVLHGGSHKEEQIKTMKDFSFFSVISETEKKRTAKEVLCFIYLLNKRHVLEHLKDIKYAETTLDIWCNEVKARAAMP